MKKFTLSFSIALLMLITCSNSFSQSVLSEDFENGQPAGWTITTNASDGGWNFGTNTQLQSSSYPIVAHTKMACSNDDGCGQVGCDKSVDYFITPSLDLSSYSAVFMSFDSYFFEATYNYVTEAATVEVSTDGGANFSVVNTLNGATDWKTLYIDLSAYAGQSDVKVAFHYNDGGDWLYGWAIDNVSIFVPSTTDIALTSIDPSNFSANSFVAPGSNISFHGTVFNNGSDAITSFTAYYSDGVNTWSDTKTGLNIGALQSYSFTHNTQYNVTVGSHEIGMWVELTGDNNGLNDSIGSVVQGYAFVPVHTTVTEEATGTWCGWCVRGIVYMDSLSHVYPNSSIEIAVHNGDPMAVSAYDNGEQSFPGFSGFPSIIVDRKSLDDPTYIFDEYDTHTDDFGFADITLDATYDAVTKIATVNASAHFAVDLSGDYRFACVFIENDVTGTGSGYAQHNYYAGGGSGVMGGFEDMPGTIPASSMHYNFVARTIVGGYTGQASSLPAEINVGETYSHEFTYHVPTADDVSQMKAIILMIDPQSGMIMNAAQGDLVITGINPVSSGVTGVYVFPNPANESINVNFSLAKSQNVSLELTDVSGRMILQSDEGNFYSGNHEVKLNSENLADGVYLLTLKTESGSVTTKVVKSK